MNICPKCNQELPPSGECPNCTDYSFDQPNSDLISSGGVKSFGDVKTTASSLICALIVFFLTGIFLLINVIALGVQLFFAGGFNTTEVSATTKILSIIFIIVYIAVDIIVGNRLRKGERVFPCLIAALLILAINLLLFNLY